VVLLTLLNVVVIPLPCQSSFQCENVKIILPAKPYHSILGEKENQFIELEGAIYLTSGVSALRPISSDKFQ